MNITKEEMLKFYKDNIVKKIPDESEEIYNLFFNLYENMFKINSFDEFMDLLNERLNNDKEFFLFNGKNVPEKLLGLLITDLSLIGGISGFSEAGLVNVAEAHMHKTAFMAVGPQKVIINKNTSKEVLMSALFHSNYFATNNYSLNTIDCVYANFTSKEVELLKKYIKSQNNNTSDINKLSNLVMELKNFAHVFTGEYYNSNFKEIDIRYTPYEDEFIKEFFHGGEDTSVIYRTKDDVNKNGVEEINNKLSKLISHKRILGACSILASDKNDLFWNEERSIELLIYLEACSNSLSGEFPVFKNLEVKENIERVLDHFVDNLPKINIAYQIFILEEMKLMGNNLKNNNLRMKKIISTLDGKIPNTFSKVKLYNNKWKNQKYNSNLEKWREELAPANEVIILRNIDILYALNNFNAKLTLDFMKKLLSGEYVNVEQSNTTFIVEIKRDEHGKSKVEKDILIDVIMSYLSSNKKDKGISFDQYIRSVKLNNLLSDTKLHSISQNKKKL